MVPLYEVVVAKLMSMSGMSKHGRYKSLIKYLPVTRVTAAFYIILLLDTCIIYYSFFHVKGLFRYLLVLQ